MAGKLNIEIDQGGKFAMSFTLKDEDNNAVSLSGATIRGQIRLAPESEDPIVDFTGTVVDGPNGEGQISLTANQTRDIPTSNSGNCKRKKTCYVWDCEVVFADGSVERVLEGVAYVSPEATR